MSLCQDLNTKLEIIKAQIKKLEELKKQINDRTKKEEIKELRNELKATLDNFDFSKTQEELEGLKYNIKEECLKLFGLEVNENDLEGIQLDKNDYIKIINLRNTNVKELSKKLIHLRKLRELYINYIPPHLEETDNIIINTRNSIFKILINAPLVEDRIMLEIIPPEIGDLINLRKLFLFDTMIEYLPHEIGNLSNLEELGLNHSKKFQSIPTDIKNLKKLNKLYLKNTLISSNKSKITNLKNLLPNTEIQY